MKNNNDHHRKSLFRDGHVDMEKSSEDGLPIVDYSSQDTRNKEDNKSSRKGKHAKTIDTSLFRKFLKDTEGLDFDIMLEIKDKEKSALKALEVVRAQEYSWSSF